MSKEIGNYFWFWFLVLYGFRAVRRLATPAHATVPKQIGDHRGFFETKSIIEKSLKLLTCALGIITCSKGRGNLNNVKRNNSCGKHSTAFLICTNDAKPSEEQEKKRAWGRHRKLVIIKQLDYSLSISIA